MKFFLPMLPPSVNSSYYTDFSTGTRHKSAAYKQFIKDCAFFIPKTSGCPLLTDLSVEFNFYVPDHRRRDASNMIKAMEDTLVKLGIIKDDSQIKRLVVEMVYEKGKAETAIEIKNY